MSTTYKTRHLPINHHDMKSTPSPDRISLTQFEEVDPCTPMAAVGYLGSLGHFLNHLANFMTPQGQDMENVVRTTEACMGTEVPTWKLVLH